MRNLLIAIFAAVYGLLAAFQTVEATQNNVPYSIVTYNDENCQGKVIASTPINNQCKNLGKTSVLYVDGAEKNNNTVSVNYDCRSGMLMSFTDADCVTFDDSSVGVLPQNSCLKANGASYRVVCSQYACQPKPGTTRKNCNQRINRCDSEFRVKMKWTGMGCRNHKGKLIGDGGCQCDGYCGYTCKGACNKDSQCYWSASDKKCKTIEGDLDGESIPQCTVLL